MTDTVIAPAVVPSVAPPPRCGDLPSPRPGVGRPLPLATLITPRAGSMVYGLSAVDDRGRVADRAVIRALGWEAGTRLDIRVAHGLVLVSANLDGVFAVTGQGHVRVPATVRRCCSFEPGDRVLLAADPVGGLLVVHPPAALDAMFTHVRDQMKADGAP